MCDRMIELGKLGSSKKMIFADIGITSDVAKTWEKKYPEFKDALDMALVNAQAYWETLMLENVNNKTFNSRMVEIAVRGQFQDTYKETRELKAEIKQDIKIDFQGEINNLIKQLRANAE